MSRTPGEQREYTRGYNRGQARVLERARAALRIAKRYRERLTDTAHMRRCSDCDRWTRGCPTCVWGSCSGDFDRAAEPAMWADHLPGETVDHGIITTEDFGCVNWLPKPDRERTP